MPVCASMTGEKTGRASGSERKMLTNAYMDMGVSSDINALGSFYPVQGWCKVGARRRSAGGGAVPPGRESRNKLDARSAKGMTGEKMDRLGARYGLAATTARWCRTGIRSK